MAIIENQGELSPQQYEWQLSLEAALFASPRPLSIKEITAAFPHLDGHTLCDLLNNIRQNYLNYGGSLTVNEVGGCYQMVVKLDVLQHPIVSKFTAGNEFTPSEVKALSFIGFNQPIVLQDIIDFLGPGIKKSVNSLLQKEFIAKTAEGAFITTETFALYLGVPNEPSLIKQKIDEAAHSH